MSVVIPCHGQAHFLPEAIVSALNQTGGDVELIVVDDGLADETAHVVSSFPSARLLRQPRMGLSMARNAGLAEATGEFIAFLDADDRLRPGAIQAGLDAFRHRPHAAFVTGHFTFIDENGVAQLTPPQKPLTGDPYLAFLRENVVPMHATVLFRRAALAAVDGFDGTLAACEDYDVYLRIAREAAVHQHDAVIAEYRRHESNMSKDPSFMLREALKVLDRQRPHVAGDPARLRSLGEGRVTWTRYYLGQMRDDVGRMRDGRERRLVSTCLAAASICARVTKRVTGSLRTRRDVLLRPGVGRVHLGHLRRTTPISTSFGYDRGRPVDRYYIESFLQRHASDIRGRVLEVGDATYTYRYGRDRVTRADVLHVNGGNPLATFVCALESGAGLPTASFDCVILTQTLHLIFDIRSALETVARILKPGGVLLATVPGISQVDPGEWGTTWSWALTPHAVQRLVDETLPGSDAVVSSHGNVLTSVAFLHGLADQELTTAELELHDPSYPMVSTARVVKGGGAP